MVYLLGGTLAISASVAGLLTMPLVPLAVAVALLACAAACSRGDGPWGAGTILLAVGLGAAAVDSWRAPPMALNATHGALAGLVVGGLVVVALRARGVAVGVAASLTAIVATLAALLLRRDLPALERPLTWSMLLLLLGAVNLLLWARDREAALDPAGPRG